MSGLIVLAQLDGGAVDAELLSAMTTAQRFRGPDAEGQWSRASVGLGHTLFRAAQEAEREAQPASLHERFFVTADARIDARDELCAKLRARGVDARVDASDPDLLLRAYASWGESCVAQLLGDFSFALWDAQRRKLVCAVDQLGVKPFYYTTRGGLFAGSNSLEPLRLHPHVRDTLNEVAVGDFLLIGGCQDRDATLYADIARIPPGHYLVIEAGRVRLQRYFALPHPAALESPRRLDAECVEQFAALLHAAVRDRLRLPRAAVYMSGGIDSTLVADVAKRTLERDFAASKLAAFTNVYERLIPDDERHYAGLMGAHLGIELNVDVMDDAVPFELYRRMTPDLPTAELTAGRSLDQQRTIARDFRVALTGFDGDALLLAAMRRHWWHCLKRAGPRRLVQDLAWYVAHERALPPIGLRTSLARLRGQRRPPPLPQWLREDFVRRVELEQRWKRLLAPPALTHPREPAWHNFANPAWGRVFDGYDAGALRCPLEVRHPLADLRIIEFALGLPAVPWCAQKDLLRRCLTGAPEAVLSRPKTPLRGSPRRERVREQGFGWAQSRWAVEPLGAYVDLDALRSAVTNHPERSRDFDFLCQSVGLGLWLAGKGRASADPPG